MPTFVVSVPVSHDPGFEDHIVQAVDALDAKRQVAAALGLPKLPFHPRQVRGPLANSEGA